MNKLNEPQRASNGFQYVVFDDLSENKCILQQSSIWLGDDNGKVGGSAILLGVNNPNPEILAKNAAKLGIKTDETCGWVSYPIPEEVSIKTRIHLNRDQVKCLISHLQNWLKNSEF
jgi:hypothetical protein